MLAGMGIRLSGPFCASAYMARMNIVSTISIVRINWLRGRGSGQDSGSGDGVQITMDSCAAYFPVCDDGGSQGSRTLLCFAYPKNKFEDAPTFEAASFSVAEVNQAISEKDCLRGSTDWVVDARGAEVINGVKFKMFKVSEAGMSQGMTGELYRAFHAGKCYQLGIRVATASSGAFDPGTTNEFTKEDWNEVNSRLRQALDSFKFLK
jgi:hypothetical protein